MTDYVTPADIVKLTLAATALEDVAAWRKRLNKPAAAQHTWTANDKTCSTEEAAVEKLVLCTHDFVDDAMLLSLEDPVHGLTTVLYCTMPMYCTSTNHYNTLLPGTANDCLIYN